MMIEFTFKEIKCQKTSRKSHVQFVSLIHYQQKLVNEQQNDNIMETETNGNTLI